MSLSTQLAKEKQQLSHTHHWTRGRLVRRPSPLPWAHGLSRLEDDVCPLSPQRDHSGVLQQPDLHGPIRAERERKVCLFWKN